MLINGVELEFDLLDADVADCVQDALEVIGKTTKKSDRLGDVIREKCEDINVFMDAVFGEGAALAVFNGKMNLKEHIHVFKEIVKALSTTREEIDMEMNALKTSMDETKVSHRKKFK